MAVKAGSGGVGWRWAFLFFAIVDLVTPVSLTSLLILALIFSRWFRRWLLREVGRWGS